MNRVVKLPLVRSDWQFRTICKGGSKILIKNKIAEAAIGSKALVAFFHGKIRTTPGIPTWSPTVVLTRPDDA